MKNYRIVETMVGVKIDKYLDKMGNLRKRYVRIYNEISNKISDIKYNNEFYDITKGKDSYSIRYNELEEIIRTEFLKCFNLVYPYFDNKGELVKNESDIQLLEKYDYLSYTLSILGRYNENDIFTAVKVDGVNVVIYDNRCKAILSEYYVKIK